MSKAKANIYSEFDESTEDFIKSLDTDNQELLGLYQIHFKQFGSTIKETGGLASVKTAWPFYLFLDEYRYKMSLFNVLVFDTGDLNYNWGRELKPDSISAVTLMQLYAEQGGTQNEYFKLFLNQFKDKMNKDLKKSVYLIPNVLHKVPVKHHNADYIPVHNYMLAKGSNLIRSEIQHLNIDCIFVMGQSSSSEQILKDVIGDYKKFNITGVERLYRIVSEKTEIPIIQAPCVPFLTVMNKTDYFLSVFEGIIIEELRSRLTP